MSEPVEQPPAAVRSRWATILPATPYHLLAWNSEYRWWRPLAALVFFAAASVVVLIAATVLLLLMALLPAEFLATRVASYLTEPGTVHAALTDQTWFLFIGFASLAALIPAVALTARWVQRRPFGSLSSVIGGLRWKWLAECLGLALIAIGLAFAATIVITALSGPSPGGEGRFPGWADYARIVLIAVVVVPFQSAAEEYVFRGLVFQTLTEWFGLPWLAAILSSVLFLGGHGYTDPLAWVQLLVMALTMCWLAVRTGGLESGIGLHIANNTLSLLLAGTSGVPGLEQAGETFSLGDVLPFVIAILGYAWIIDRRAARRGLHTVVGARARISPWTLGVSYPRDDLPAGLTA